MVLQAVKLMFNLCLMSAVECYVSFFNTVPSTKTPSSFSHNNAPNPFLPLRDSSHLMVAKRRENQEKSIVDWEMLATHVIVLYIIQPLSLKEFLHLSYFAFFSCFYELFFYSMCFLLMYFVFYSLVFIRFQIWLILTLTPCHETPKATLFSHQFQKLKV